MDMLSFRIFKLSRIFFILLVCLFSLTILPSQVYCDDWVSVGSDDEITIYYNSSSINIDRKNKIIKVWDKWVFTEKGKIEWLKFTDNNNNPKYNDFHYKRSLHVYDYKNWKRSLTHTIDYSKLGNILFDCEYQPEMKNIIPGTRVETILLKVLKNYNIQR